VDEGYVELGLDTAVLLKLSEESTPVGRDGGKGILKSIENILLRQCNGDVFDWAGLFGYLRLLLLK
jgi:hypothetical protein